MSTNKSSAAPSTFRFNPIGAVTQLMLAACFTPLLLDAYEYFKILQTDNALLDILFFFKYIFYSAVFAAPVGFLSHLLTLVSPAFIYSDLSYLILLPYSIGVLMMVGSLLVMKWIKVFDWTLLLTAPIMAFGWQAFIVHKDEKSSYNRYIHPYLPVERPTSLV